MVYCENATSDNELRKLKKAREREREREESEEETQRYICFIYFAANHDKFTRSTNELCSWSEKNAGSIDSFQRQNAFSMNNESYSTLYSSLDRLNHFPDRWKKTQTCVFRQEKYAVGPTWMTATRCKLCVRVRTSLREIWNICTVQIVSGLPIKGEIHFIWRPNILFILFTNPRIFIMKKCLSVRQW